MSEGYRKIFWGIFIATFNIKIGIVKILPAFVGFIIISSGINILIEETNIESFKKAKRYSNYTGLLLFLGGVISLSGVNLEANILIQLLPIIYLTLELLLFYKVFEGSIEKLSYDNNPTLAMLVYEFENKQRFYTISSIIINLFLMFSITFNWVSQTFAAILLIILRIFLMTSMSRLKNLYLNDENPEVN